VIFHKENERELLVAAMNRSEKPVRLLLDIPFDQVEREYTDLWENKKEKIEESQFPADIGPFGFKFFLFQKK
jgi:hypothetical protein